MPNNLNPVDMMVLGLLMAESIQGEITSETMNLVRAVDQTKVLEPLGHILRYSQGYHLNGKKLAFDLLDEIRIICIEMQEERNSEIK